jgi:hypothetical protein
MFLPSARSVPPYWCCSCAATGVVAVEGQRITECSPLVTTRVQIRIAILAAVALSAFFTSPTSAGDPLPSVRLVNISTRLPVGTGNNVLIGGFIITGTQPKKVLLRGLGPTLPVIENLADPTLELHDSSGAVLSANDNWMDTQQADVQATTIPPGNDYEPAMVKVLSPGAYTVILAGKGQTGDNVLIGGTIIVGSGSTNVLFRALGPSLVGVSNALQDPMLELHDSQGSIIATNDNWQDSQAAAIRATTIQPSDPREAAIIQQLSPGAYTAVVRGKNNTTGVALVEAYQIN